jgi:hopanoid biosynthesis associated RND transporter like protein HpnN
MLARIVLKTIDFAIRRAWVVITVSALLTFASIVYAASNFAITTDINKLISPDLPWRQREAAYNKAFPNYNLLLVVVNAPTSELADRATATLADALAKRTDRFKSVSRPPAEAFFERNGLLFQSPEELAKTTAQLAQAEPIVHDLSADPSLRGLMDALTDGLMGVQAGRYKLDALTGTFERVTATLEDILAGRPASFSWRALAEGKNADPAELRRFIDVRPVLDYTALEPGRVASETIRDLAKQLDLPGKFQANVRLTGPVALMDEEFSTIKENAFLNESITVAIVLLILWWALRSAKVIFAVFANLVVGLAITAALGMMMVPALNLISVYFAVLFVGLGVDFGIQFSVRYRAERHEVGDLKRSLLVAGKHVGAPLTLAAAAVAAGFFSFLPTAYRGVSELGLIAGVGMLIAFFTSITTLPAILALLNPPGEPEPLGFLSLAPVDRFMERHRIPIIIGTAAVVIMGLPLLFLVRFDFNPMHLRSPKAESVATYLELAKDPNTSSNSIEMLLPSAVDAELASTRLRALPQVSRVTSLTSFVPDLQKEKLALIDKAAKKLKPALHPNDAQPRPSDAENVEALKDEASRLTEISEGQNGTGAVAARRLAAALTKLAAASEDVRKRTEAVFLDPLRTAFQQLENSLNAHPISVPTLPPELVRQWQLEDGRTRVEITPKGDADNEDNLKEFTRAVLAVEPTATGAPVAVLESGHTIISAFIEAGGWALLSIAILLWITLGRIGDVLLTLVPLALAGVVTLEICGAIDLPLNFANIIALPLLLGVGVAFKIYYIMAWRAGQTNLLQSSLTRAVTFSALATATAFGSLWFSSHPGTSSMGKLLALSLLCTLAAAVLFQPVLMGKPRHEEEPVPGSPPTPVTPEPSAPDRESSPTVRAAARANPVSGLASRRSLKRGRVRR